MRNERTSVGAIPRGSAFWATPSTELLATLQTTHRGLSGEAARERLATLGPNMLRRRQRFGTLSLLLAQFRSPIVLILLFAAFMSLFLGQRSDALIILSIVAVSGLLGFWQERGATGAVEALLARVRIRADVIRDGTEQAVGIEEVVPGDVVLLRAGDMVPADCLILESKDLYVDEASLTGETYPIEKSPALVPPETSLAHRSNCLLLGTHVVSGTACA